MDLPKLQALIAPVATPVAPALLLGNEMYQVMKAVEIHWFLALISATIAVVGLEFSGALTCYMAVKAWGRRDWTAMLFSVIGSILYAAIIIGGIWIMPEQRAQVFGVMVLVTLVAYFGYGLYHSYIDQDTRQDKQLSSQVELIRQKRLLVNADTRRKKASVQPSIGRVQLSNGQNGQDITATGQAVIDYLNEHGDGQSLRAIASELGCSPQTVKNWLDYWRDSNA